MADNVKIFLDELKSAKNFGDFLVIIPPCQPPDPVLNCASPYVQALADFVAYTQDLNTFFTEFKSNPLSLGTLNAWLAL